MAQAPLKRCSHPGCGRLIRGASRCPEHRKRSRGKPDPFYQDHRWRKFRAAFLQEHPLCVRCAEQGKTTAAVVVDHVVDRCDAPDRAYDPTNMEPLCISHHNQKTARTVSERRRRRGGGGSSSDR